MLSGIRDKLTKSSIGCTILKNQIVKLNVFAKRVLSRGAVAVPEQDEANMSTYLVFKAKYHSSKAKAEEQTKEEGAELTAITAQGVSTKDIGRTWRITRWSKVTQRAISIAVISLFLILIGGTSFAFAQPENALATPFKGVAITMTKAPSAAIRLIEEVRGVVATYERNIVSTSLQSMRVIEYLRVVPAVTVPTNDMACFPSPEHCLFPDYLDKRFSQFKYTVDSDGIVSVDTSGATTDALLGKIEQRLNRLTEEK